VNEFGTVDRIIYVLDASAQRDQLVNGGLLDLGGVASLHTLGRVTHRVDVVGGNARSTHSVNARFEFDQSGNEGLLVLGGCGIRHA
jgi:hypothetical protein